jgi:hypothetical protein
LISTLIFSPLALLQMAMFHGFVKLRLVLERAEVVEVAVQL